MSKAKAPASNHRPGKPKTTAQGAGRGSRPGRSGKKKSRGQGR